MNTRIGYAAGAFDLFHIGHLNLLAQARQRCDYLIAGVVSDELLRATKGRAPVVPLAERLEIVRNIRYVDEAVAKFIPAGSTPGGTTTSTSSSRVTTGEARRRGSRSNSNSRASGWKSSTSPTRCIPPARFCAARWG